MEGLALGGLIDEIQRLSLDSAVPLDSLLRRVKLAAGKLQLDDLDKWVDQELNGYSGEVPEYRWTQGQLSAWNPFKGWIPVHLGHEDLDETVNKAPIREPISSLQDLVDNGSGGPFLFPIPPGIVSTLNEILNYPTARMTIQLSRGNIVNILSTVRNMVLDWAIRMEQKGVLGENMSFDSAEKKQARQAMPTIQIGSIGNFSGNLGSQNSARDIIASNSSVQSIQELVEKLRSSIPELEKNGVNRQKLEESIHDIESEATSQKPDKKILAARLADLRSILVGAAGSLTAEGAMALISSILSAL